MSVEYQVHHYAIVYTIHQQAHEVMIHRILYARRNLGDILSN